MSKLDESLQYGKAKITKEEIRDNYQKIVLKDSYSIRKVFTHPKYRRKSRVIYSMWDGYLDKNNLRNYWKNKGISIKIVHSSGHAYIDDLRKLKGAINPKKIIPVHTFNPEYFFREFGKKKVIVEYGVPVKVLKIGEE